MIILKDYQQEAVNQLMSFYHASLNGSIPLLVAPTGAGKTIMAGGLINQILLEDKNTCFIWISIGKSGLHEQSKYKVDKFFPKISTFSIDDILSTNKQELDAGDVLFLNWEAVTQKSKKTGTWSNIFMRQGENITLSTLTCNTRSNGIKIIMLVDEAHSRSASLRGSEIIKIINPQVIFNITATPRKKQYEDAKNFVVKVDSKRVMQEGVIKKNIIVNKGIRSDKNIIIDLLVTANKRREQLLSLYKKENSNVNPLCLIQLPNGADGDLVLEEVENFLSSLDKTEENGKLAVWTSATKINLDLISSPTATQEFLIFKQAIDTGWDCPRAQILVKYRDIKSEVFKEQILGRILRMPELKHYNNPILNDAYVFTNEDSFSVDKPEDLPSGIETLTEMIPLKTEVCSNIMYTIIPSFAYIKVNSLLNKRDLMLTFMRYIDDHLKMFKERYEVHKEDLHLTIPLDLVYNTVDGVVTVAKSKDTKVTTVLLRGTIHKAIKLVISDDKVCSGIIDYILNRRPEEMPLYDYLGSIAVNLNYITDKLGELVSIYQSHPTVRVEDIPVVYNSIPPAIPVKEIPIENPTFRKYLYMWYPYKTITRTDTAIIDELENNDEVEWWFYNRNFAYALGVPVIVNGQSTIYKPRFIAKKLNTLVVIDYVKSEENRKDIVKMLEVLTYRSGIKNISLDIRVLAQNNSSEMAL